MCKKVNSAIKSCSSEIFSQLPFFKGGIFSVALKPLFGKEGEGEIYSANSGEPH
jgi:hypothetical protein